MLVGFFLHLKACKLPVSTREFLTLLEALDERVVSTSLTDFYTLARATLVKDEQHFDRFDVAFGTFFNGIESVFDASSTALRPLRSMARFVACPSRIICACPISFEK